MNKFKNYKFEQNISIEEYIRLIKEGFKVSEIEALRKLPKGDPLYSHLKKDRPTIAMHSIYGIGALGTITRDEDCIIGYTNLLYFDIDDANFEIPKEIYDKAYIIHRSCGGKGWGIIVKVNSINKLTFKPTYAHIANYELCIPWDKACNDISRIVFLSYDPEIYINPNAPIFQECDPYEDTVSYNHNVSVETTGNFNGIAYSPLTKASGEEYYYARQQMAHALIAVFGNTPDSFNFYKGCLALGGQNGHKTDHAEDYTCWYNAARKTSFSIITTQLQVFNRYCPQLLSILKIENAPVFTRTINDYVEEDAEFLLDFIRKHKKIILDSPPGTGKTSFIKQILPQLSKDIKISVVMPTTLLSEQQEHVWLEGVDLSNIEIVTGKRVVKNMNIPLLITTYASVKKTLGRKGVLCIDECQHIASDMYRVEHIRNVLDVLDDFEYVIFMSGTPINLHLLPGVELIKYNRATPKTIDMIVGCDEIAILSEPDTKKLCFRDDSKKNRVDADMFIEKGFNAISVNADNKEDDRIKEIIRNEQMGDLDIIFTTRLMHDGINIKDLGKKSILLLSPPDHLAYLVQLANRFRDTGQTTLYANINLRDTNTYIEPDFANQIKYYQIIADSYTMRLSSRKDNVNLIRHDIFKEDLMPIYFDSVTFTYKVCIASLLYKDMKNRSRCMDEIQYLKDYGINIISRGFVSKIGTKVEIITENIDLRTALSNLIGDVTDWHPTLIKERLERVDIKKWPKCISRYVKSSELAKLYYSVPLEELIAVADIENESEYKSMKYYLFYKHYLKNPNNALPLTEIKFEKLTTLRNALRHLVGTPYETTDIYNIVGRITGERAGLNQKIYLNMLFSIEKIKKTSTEKAKFILTEREF
jgi:hypothetical protein